MCLSQAYRLSSHLRPAQDICAQIIGEAGTLIELIFLRGSLHAGRELFPDLAGSGCAPDKDSNVAQPKLSTRLRMCGDEAACQGSGCKRRASAGEGETESSQGGAASASSASTLELASGWWGMELEVEIQAESDDKEQARPGPPGVYAVDLVRGLPSVAAPLNLTTTWMTCRQSPESLSLSLSQTPSSGNQITDNAASPPKPATLPQPDGAAALSLHWHRSLMARACLLIFSLAVSSALLACILPPGPASVSTSRDRAHPPEGTSQGRWSLPRAAGAVWWRSPPQAVLVAVLSTRVCSYVPDESGLGSISQVRQDCKPHPQP